MFFYTFAIMFKVNNQSLRLFTFYRIGECANIFRFILFFNLEVSSCGSLLKC